MVLYFFYAFLVSGFLNLTCSILVLRGMADAGVKVSFFEIRWQVHKHLKAYRELTRDKKGRVAWPYYAYQASLVCTISFALLAVAAVGQ